MALIWDRGDKKYKRYVRQYTAAYKLLYCQTRDKYNLDIDDYTAECNAIRYAKAKADEHFQVFTDAFKGGNLFNFIAALIGAIVGIALAVFSGGASLVASIASMASAVVSGAVSITGSIVGGILNTNASHALKYYSSASTALGLAKHIAQKQNTNNTRTNALIYHPYAILAEGSIYKDGAPGSPSYAGGVEAFNPMKGILGSKSINVLGEKLTNRAHRHLAGNANYEPLDQPIPKAEHDLYNPLKINYLKINIDTRMEQLKQGFKVLAENYFGAFDEGGNPLPKMFEQHQQKYIYPIINNINSESFIIQNQYYRLGLRLPLFEKLEKPGQIKARNFYEQRGLCHVRNWQKDYEFARKYWYWFDYAINQDGLIVYKKRNEESFEEKHKIEGQVLALLWFQQHKETPKISELAQTYLDKDKYNLDINEEYRAKRAYEDYLIAYWDCFNVYLLDESTNLRPNESAYRDWYYWKYEAVTGFDNRRENYYDMTRQIRSWEQVFFNSLIDQDKLSEEEKHKANTFKGFVQAELIKQERAIFNEESISVELKIEPIQEDFTKKSIMQIVQETINKNKQ